MHLSHHITSRHEKQRQSDKKMIESLVMLTPWRTSREQDEVMERNKEKPMKQGLFFQ